MPRYIDADKIHYHEKENIDGYVYSCVADKNEIDSIPTEDVQPVVHTEWVDNEIPKSILYACSNCGFPSGAYSFNYCPNCSAKMMDKDND